MLSGSVRVDGESFPCHPLCPLKGAIGVVDFDDRPVFVGFTINDYPGEFACRFSTFVVGGLDGNGPAGVLATFEPGGDDFGSRVGVKGDGLFAGIEIDDAKSGHLLVEFWSCFGGVGAVWACVWIGDSEEGHLVLKAIELFAEILLGCGWFCLVVVSFVSGVVGSCVGIGDGGRAE